MQVLLCVEVEGLVMTIGKGEESFGNFGGKLSTYKTQIYRDYEIPDIFFEGGLGEKCSIDLSSYHKDIATYELVGETELEASNCKRIDRKLEYYTCQLFWGETPEEDTTIYNFPHGKMMLKLVIKTYSLEKGKLYYFPNLETLAGFTQSYPMIMRDELHHTDWGQATPYDPTISLSSPRDLEKNPLSGRSGTDTNACWIDSLDQGVDAEEIIMESPYKYKPSSSPSLRKLGDQELQKCWDGCKTVPPGFDISSLD